MPQKEQSSPTKEIKSRYKKLIDTINLHRKKYHNDDFQEISESALDALKHELAEIEKKYPSLITSDSPSQRVEGGVKKGLAKIEHKVPQWSFNDVFDEDEFSQFVNRVKKNLPNEEIEYFCEGKIDGLKAVLTYENGSLITAATRGDGKIGEDVTNNLKTIADIPHKLTKKIDVIVEGEIWLSKKEFNRINKEREKKGEEKYANPRNLAAGSIRQLDSNVCKSRKLNFFAYDIALMDNVPGTQQKEYIQLKKLGFKVGEHTILAKTQKEVIKYWKNRFDKQKVLTYLTDGVVVKVNDRNQQIRLGYTGKAPRFAIAIKFPAEEQTSEIQDITFQIGRTGVITPVAHLKPVSIAGTTVTRATLHNEDQIKTLDVRVNDTVIVRKAGDIIPEVVKVLKEMRPKNTKQFKFPKKIEGCGGDGSIERLKGEVAYRCVNRNSFSQQVLRLQYFVGKSALDIDGLGKKTIETFIEHNLISEYADIFEITKDEIAKLEGFKEKSAQNIIDAIASKNKVPLSRLLVGLSIDGVGEGVAILLSNKFKSIQTLRKAKIEELESIQGIGDELAKSIYDWFKDQRHSVVLDRLLKHISIEKDKIIKGEFTNKNIAITGKFSIDREEIKRVLREQGASVVSSISKKTELVLVGDNPGSKYKEALKLNIKIIKEKDIMVLLK